MTDTPSDAEQLARAVANLDKSLARLSQPHSGHVVSANIQASAGGVGLWLSVTCTLIMFVVVILQAHDKARMAEDIRELRQDYDEMQAYLNAIYQQAPQLRPKQEGSKHE